MKSVGSTESEDMTSLFRILALLLPWQEKYVKFLAANSVCLGNQIIRPQAISLLQIRPIQIRLHAHSVHIQIPPHFIHTRYCLPS